MNKHCSPLRRDVRSVPLQAFKFAFYSELFFVDKKLSNLIRMEIRIWENSSLNCRHYNYSMIELLAKAAAQPSHQYPTSPLAGPLYSSTIYYRIQDG